MILCIEVKPLSKLAEMGVSLLFKLLGWDVSSDKETCFDSIAKVLGLKIDLSDSRLGKIYFRNTDSRRDELFDSLSKILEEGRLARKDGERLRGRLQFAEAQISGKVACRAYKRLSRFILQGGGPLTDEVRATLLTLRDRVNFAPPR